MSQNWTTLEYLEKTEKNKLLLDNLRTNRERVILPSSQRKIKKNVLSSFSNQNSVIFLSVLLV